VLGVFIIGSLKVFAQDRLQTTILLISSSLVARITDVSHRCPNHHLFLMPSIKKNFCFLNTHPTLLLTPTACVAGRVVTHMPTTYPTLGILSSNSILTLLQNLIIKANLLSVMDTTFIT
jgi:hypothetical protein